MKTPGSARQFAVWFSALRLGLTRLVVVIGLAASIVPARAVTPSSDDGFAPRANAQVVASTIDPSGRIIVGGYFTELQTPGVNDPVLVGRIARINPDGSIDTSFLPSANGPVTSILLEPDGKIVIGGYFTSVSSGTSTFARNRVARFNENGTVDESFDPNVGGTSPALVHVAALARDSSGRILIGGEFTTIAPNGTAAQDRLRIARFNSNGSFDATFTPGFNNVVNAIAVHQSGDLIVAGGFTTAAPSGDSTPVARGRLARLTSTGALTAYNPNANNLVTALAFQIDGNMIAVGNFTSLQPPGATAALTHSRIARIKNDGSLDETFKAGLNSNALAVAVTPDGRIIVSGVFRGAFSTGQTAGSRADFIARFAADGTLDTSFFPGPSYTVSTFALQSDGKIFIGGSFTDFYPASNVNGIARRYMARLNEDGSLDASLDPSIGGSISVVTEQADGSILLGGTFSSIAGITRRAVARISADGVVDPVFDPSANGQVSALVEQSDKRILIGGAFSRLSPNGATTPVTRNFLARVTQTGELDADFDPNPNGAVSAIAVQQDNKILIAGNFTSLTPNGTTTAVARTALARLEAGGGVDTTFETTANGLITSIVVEPDGKILIAGSFSAITVGTSSFTAGGLARLNADGTFVTGFSPNTNNVVSAVHLYDDGKILIGGAFTAVTPSSSSGGVTTIARNRIALLNADGSLVETFDPNANDVVNVIVPLEGGDILVGGRFSDFAPNGATEAIVRRGLARIKSDGTLATSYDPSPNSQIVAMIVQASGDAVVAGPFTGFRPTGSVAVQLTKGLARINDDGSIDTAFTTEVGGATGEIRAIAYQRDGAMFIGGAFASVAGSTSRNLVRMRPEGIPDTQFHPDADGTVEAVVPRTLADDDSVLNHRIGWLAKDGKLRTGLAIDPGLQIDGAIESVAVQDNGNILVGGTFTASTGDTTISNLARFKPDGSLDKSFNPGPNGLVSEIHVKGDRIVIVGGFTAVGAVTRNRVAALNLSGVLNTGFDPNANGIVVAAAIQPDDKILIGGQFTTLTPNGATTAVAVNRIARLNADGTVDTPFNPNANSDINTIAIQPGATAADFKIVIGGAFDTLQPNGAASSTARTYMARLNADGTLDTTFDPKPNGQVAVIRNDPDGRFVVGGLFSSFQPNGATDPITRNNIARIMTDGTVDAGFNASANSAVFDLDFQSDKKLIIGGQFTNINDVARSRIARLNTDGTLDTTFNPNAGGSVGAVVVLDNDENKDEIIAAGSFTSFRIGGVVLAGGAFQQIGKTANPFLALLSTDGTPIPGGAPAVNGAVRAFALQQDGNVILAGDFTQAGGAAHAHIARLLASDTIDAEFNAAADGNVHALAIQSDGKILIGGTFDTVGAGARKNLARLNSDGTLDAALAADTNGVVAAITVQADGQILVGGSFTSLSGATVTNIGRVAPSGAIDPSFAPVLNGVVNSIALQTDGSVLIGGTFTTVNGTPRNGLAKLSPTGVVDPNYDPQGNGTVSALVLAPDGKLIVGGTFSKIGGQSRYLIARLSPSIQAKISLKVGADNKSIEWLRSDSSPEILAATFEVQEDGIWGSPIDGTRFVAGGIPGWRATVPEEFAQDKLLYIRARGIVASNHGGSTSFIETVRAVFISSSGGGTGDPNDPEVPARPSNFLAETYLSAHPELANDLYGEPDRLDLAWVHYWTYSRSADAEQIFLPPAGQASIDPKLINLSARSWVGSGEQSLIMGIHVAEAPAKLLVRARGPSLADFSIPNPLADPSLTIYSGQTPIALNDDWGTESSVTQQALTEAGITMTNSRDSAIVVTLQPGAYTFVISSKGGTGVALGELFQLSGSSGRLTNLSARAQVGEGGDILIAGFNRLGVGEILVRGLGPELANHSIVNFLADPYITLHKQSTGTMILANNDWGQVVGAISDKNVRAGALPLPDGSKDSAAYMVLGSGGYTIHVGGAQAGQTGVALIELFELR